MTVQDDAAVAVRVHAGIEIEGTDITIGIYPCSDEGADGVPRVSVVVGGQPALTGFKQPSRLSSDIHNEFTLNDVRVDDDLLTCLAPSPHAPIYRQGFTVALEPGMAALVRQALQRVEHVSAVTAAAVRAVESLMPTRDESGPRLWPHHRSVITHVVADMLLDRSDFNQMLDVELAAYTNDETAFKTAMNDRAVRQLIESAGRGEV